MEKVLKRINWFLARMQKHYISEYAAQCAYYIILSFIPFIILIFTLIQYANIGQDVIFYVVQNIMPINISGMIENILKEIYFKSIGTLSVSLIITIWSAGKGFLALCKGLHSVYEIGDKNSFVYLKLRSTLCTVVFILAIVAVLILTVFGRGIVSTLEQNVEIINSLANILLKGRNIILFLLLFITFALMYKFVPGHKVKLKDQLPGAAFATISWYVISYIFSIYVGIFTNFSLIYGSLTAIILLMMWVYFCMYFILIGAEINKIRSEKKK